VTVQRYSSANGVALTMDFAMALPAPCLFECGFDDVAFIR